MLGELVVSWHGMILIQVIVIFLIQVMVIFFGGGEELGESILGKLPPQLFCDTATRDAPISPWLPITDYRLSLN